MSGVELVLAFLAGVAMGIALDRWLLLGAILALLGLGAGSLWRGVK